MDKPQLEKVVKLISSNDPLETIEKTFAEFPSDTYPYISAIVSNFASEEMISTVGNHTEALVGFYLCHLMSNTFSEAKAAVHRFVTVLEQHIKDDAKKAEQIKYRQTTKDFKMIAKEAVDADSGTSRLALKCFVFTCLLDDRIDTKQTPEAILSVKQSDVDAKLASWVSAPTKLREKINALVSSSERECEKCSLSGVGAFSSATFPLATPKLCRLTPSSPVLYPGELHYMIAGNDNQLVAFDSKGHKQEWKTTQSLIVKGIKEKLSSEDTQKITSSLHKDPFLVNRMGLAPDIIAKVSEMNPETAAMVLTKLDSASNHLEKILSLGGNISYESIATVFVHTIKSMRQINVNSFIALSGKRIKESPPSGKAELVKIFASAVHQLVVRGVKENKDVYLTDTRKAEVRSILEEHKGIQEVTSCIADLK
eukprot:Tbor_TRINITY_DN5453_c0_g5::TRINITY_DN5453_c0_g5_i1::g.25356::m.25356